MKTTYVSWSEQFQPTNYNESNIKFVNFLSKRTVLYAMKLSINPGLSFRI